MTTSGEIHPVVANSLPRGVGNTVAGLIGALPVTSVIVRSSVNVGAGAKTKLSTILHGVLLAVCVAIFPIYLNMIPLAAILLVTGLKLASPLLFRRMWSEGRYQFIPFLVTLVSIVFTDSNVSSAAKPGGIDCRRSCAAVGDRQVGTEPIEKRSGNGVSAYSSSPRSLANTE